MIFSIYYYFSKKIAKINKKKKTKPALETTYNQIGR